MPYAGLRSVALRGGGPRCKTSGFYPPKPRAKEGLRPPPFPRLSGHQKTRADSNGQPFDVLRALSSPYGVIETGVRVAEAPYGGKIRVKQRMRIWMKLPDVVRCACSVTQVCTPEDV